MTVAMKNDLTGATHYLSATRVTATEEDAYGSPIYGDDTPVVDGVPVRLDSWERMRSRGTTGERERQEPAIRVSDPEAIDALQVGDQVLLKEDPDDPDSDAVKSGDLVGMERVYGRFSISHVFLEVDDA